MDNIILIISNDKIVIDNKIKEIQNTLKEAETVQYDLTETPIETVIEDLDTYNFLAPQKIIVCYNSIFLTAEKKKELVEHNLDKLEKYIDNPNPDNVLILITDSVDKRKKIVNSIIKKVKTVESKIDIKEIIKRELDGYKIDYKTINLLIDYCSNDSERIINEISKLKMYKFDEKEITEDDIKKTVTKKLDDNIFGLIDSILNQNKKYAFELYNDLVLHGEQPVTIISVLSNKIRLIYQVKILSKTNTTDSSISKLLKVHEYPVKLARQMSYKYSEEVLLKYLNKLAELDYQIKSGKSTVSDHLFQMLIAEI